MPAGAPVAALLALLLLLLAALTTKSSGTAPAAAGHGASESSASVTAAAPQLQRADPRCELNGRWANASNAPAAAAGCLCEPAWTGPTCGTLRLGPVNPAAGFHGTTGNSGARTSSWGAATIEVRE